MKITLILLLFSLSVFSQTNVNYINTYDGFNYNYTDKKFVPFNNSGQPIRWELCWDKSTEGFLFIDSVSKGMFVFKMVDYKSINNRRIYKTKSPSGDFYTLEMYEDKQSRIEIKADSTDVKMYFISNNLIGWKDTINTQEQAGKEFYLDAMKKEEVGKYKEAIEAYTKCIEVEPIAEAYFNRGHAKDAIQDHIGAIEDMETVIKLKPELAYLAYSDMGLYRYNLKDYKGSIDCCNKSIHLKPIGEAYMNRALSKRALKKPFCEDLKKSKEMGAARAAEYYDIDCK